MSSRYDDKLFKGAPAKNFEHARELRKKSTVAEELLWQQLRNRKAGGLKFRRQHPVSRYSADFYCCEAELVIEAAGPVHNSEEAKAYDNARTNDLASLGMGVLRFTNTEVETAMPGVLKRILDFINKT